MFGFYDKYFKFFGIDIAYYGLVIAIGMGLGVFVACKNARFRGLKTEDLIIVACYVLPLAIIGARIYYVIFSLDKYTSFWQVFEIWKGGMAIYGGVIGGAIGILLYCLIHKKNFLDVADIAVPSLILGQAIGRWGNFFNQEAYGFYVDNPPMQWFPFSVYIERCVQDGCTCGGAGWHLATFFYESLWNLITFAILMYLLRKNKLKLRGSLMSLYLIIYGTGRAWIEGLRMDSLYIGAIRTSQLLSILLIISGIGFIICSYILQRKGKIKSLTELQPYYQANLATEDDKKIKHSKNDKNKDQQLVIDMSGVNSSPDSEPNNEMRENSEEQKNDKSEKKDMFVLDDTKEDNNDKNENIVNEKETELTENNKTLETIDESESSNQVENKGKKNKKQN